MYSFLLLISTGSRSVESSFYRGGGGGQNLRFENSQRQNHCIPLLLAFNLTPTMVSVPNGSISLYFAVFNDFLTIGPNLTKLLRTFEKP